MDNFKIERLPNTADLIELIRAKGGYCLCSIEKTADTKCPCKEFRNQDHEGQCHCGVYTKVKIS